MNMNLQENIQRIREIMEVKPLNENTSKFRGKFGDFINRIFKNKKDKGDVSNAVQKIVNVGNKYEQKYGKHGDGIVETFTMFNERDKYNSLLDIDIFTEETMKCITFYLTDFVNDQSSKVSYSYEFYKTLYYKDGVLTDEFSFINQDGNSICSTDTLEGEKGGCTLSSEVKQNILKRYEKDSTFISSQIQDYQDIKRQDYQDLKRYLDRISY